MQEMLLQNLENKIQLSTNNGATPQERTGQAVNENKSRVQKLGQTKKNTADSASLKIRE